MARLIFSDGRERELDPEAPTTLGSSPDATVRIAAAGSSELHCVIRSLKDGGFGLKDLGTGTGIFVNGREVRAVRLRHGDEVRVGSVTVRFDDGEEATDGRTPPTEAAQPVAPDGNGGDLPVGQWLGGYEIGGVVGHGGMGTVYRAVQLSLHREVALKVLKPELCEDPSFVKRFVSEARAAGRFNHPNVVQVFDVVEHDGRPFYSMELLPGGSLEDHIRASGPLDIAAAVAATSDAARGLAYADELGVVHRDIKPDNLMPTAQGTIKICDLGLATDPATGKKDRILGTPHFISPEQARGQPVDHRSDLYSLGCTFFRLLTGKNPFQRRTVREILKAHLEAPVPKVRDVAPEIPEDIEAVVTKLLAKDPAERYQHAADLVADLDAWVERQKQGRRLHVAVLVILVLGLGAGVAYLLLRNPETEVRTVVKDDPEAAKIAAQNKEMRAENALLRISKSLPRIARATRLEALAKEHAGTKASVRALREAGRLRREEEAELTRIRQKSAREAALAARITAESHQRLAANDPLAAWRHAVRLAGSGNRPKVVGAAVDGVHEAVVAAVRGRAEAAWTTLETGLQSENADVAELAATFHAALALGKAPVPDDVPALLDTMRKRGDALIARVRKQRDAAKAARRARLLAARRDLLTADDGALALVRAGRLDAALAKLAATKPPPEFAEEWKPIDTVRRLVTAARAGAGRLQDAVRRQTKVSVTYLGEDFRLAATEDGTLVLSRPGGEERRVGLWDAPALAAELFGKPLGDAATEPPAARTTRLAVVATVVLANGLPQAVAFLDTIRDGEVEAAPSFPWIALPPLEDGHGLPPEVAAELAALVHLGKLLRAWQQGADEAATYHADVLEHDLAHTAVGVALGIEPPHAPDPAANSRRKGAPAVRRQ